VQLRTRVQLDPNLGGLAGNYLHVANFGPELRVLDADSVLTFVEGRVGLPEEARVQRRHHRVVQRKDLNSCIGHCLLGLGIDDDRDQITLTNGRLEIVREGQERSGDRDNPRGEADDGLESG